MKLLGWNSDGTRDGTFSDFIAERIVGVLPLADGRIMVYAVSYPRGSPGAPQLVRLNSGGDP